MFMKFIKSFFILVGAFTVIVALTIFLGIKSFTPLVQVDEKGVRMFGNMLVIENSGNSVPSVTSPLSSAVSVETQQVVSSGTKVTASMTGSQDVDLSKALIINFNNASIEVDQSYSNQITWACKSDSANPPSFANNKLTLDFGNQSGKCDIHVPAKVDILVAGNNGKVDLEYLNNNQSVKLANGKVDLDELAEMGYNYKVAIKNGSWNNLSNKAGSKIIDVAVEIENGRFEADRH